MAYMKNIKFDYRSNGELKSLDFNLFFHIQVPVMNAYLVKNHTTMSWILETLGGIKQDYPNKDDGIQVVKDLMSQ